MSRTDRIPKSLIEKVAELDNHLFELRKSLQGLRSEDTSNLIIITGELRNLICQSSGTEGLLWRLVDELRVSDRVYVLCSGLFPDHLGLLPNASNELFLAFNHRTDPFFKDYSFRDIVKNCESVRYHGRGYTYEQLVSKYANQMGTPHTDDGVEPLLIALKKHAEFSHPSYHVIYDFLSDIVIEIGERVIKVAEANYGYRRQLRPGFGDISLFVAVIPDLILEEKPTTFSYGSHTIGIYVKFTFQKDEWKCEVSKADGSNVSTTVHYYSPNMSEVPILGAVWQYSSNLRRGRIINSFIDTQNEFDCDLGWFDARDTMRFTKLRRRRFPEQQCILSHGIFGRLISTSEARELAITIPDPTVIVGNYPARARKLKLDPSKSFMEQMMDTMFDDDSDIQNFPP